MTRIGNGAAVVVQVVSADSGIIVFSNTQQAYSMNDVATQAQEAREAILEISGRGTEASVRSPRPPRRLRRQPTARPSTSRSGNLFSGLFHKGGKAAVTPGPGATPHVKPSRGVIVAHVKPARAPPHPTPPRQRAPSLGYGTFFTTTTTNADATAMTTAQTRSAEQSQQHHRNRNA